MQFQFRAEQFGIEPQITQPGIYHTQKGFLGPLSDRLILLQVQLFLDKSFKAAFIMDDGV